jgi:hypothetical protein
MTSRVRHARTEHSARVLVLRCGCCGAVFEDDAVAPVAVCPFSRKKVRASATLVAQWLQYHRDAHVLAEHGQAVDAWNQWKVTQETRADPLMIAGVVVPATALSIAFAFSVAPMP